MKFEKLPIEGALKIVPEKREDARGFFARAYCAREFAEAGLPTDWVQMNLSYNRAPGTLRGLHYQGSPHKEAKLVRCVRGEILDVVADLRSGSPTYGRHCAVNLQAESHAMVFVPEGCAHGFQTLTPDAELLYFHTEFYSPEAERGIRYDDPTLAIEWPLAVTGISDRDFGHPLLAGMGSNDR